MGITIGIATIGPVATNCYIAGTDTDAVIIDPASGTPDDIEIITSLVAGRRVHGILITHGHFDHIAGLSAAREHYRAPVYVHTADARMLIEAGLNLSAAFGLSITSAAAEHTLSDGAVFTLGNMTFTLLHTPGHTAGSSCYAVEDVLFCGDTLFAHGIGRTDLPGGNTEQIFASIKERLYTLPPDTHCYPGHDNDFTIAERMKLEL